MIKKLLLLLTIAIFAISCTTEEYYTEPINSYSKSFTIDKWKWHPTELYFYWDVEIPELTSFVYNNGSITTYYLARIDDANVAYPLPYDYYMNDKGIKWAEHYTCEISPGWVRFVFQYDDLEDSPIPPALDFKINMMW